MRLDTPRIESEPQPVPAVTLDRVTRSFRESGGRVIRALDGLSVDVPDGGLLVLLGPSGAGKTTALRIVAGLDRADSGEVLFDGSPVNDLRPRDRNVAVVFQDHPLLPRLNVSEQIGFALRIRRMPTVEIERRVRDVVAFLGLEPLAARPPEGLSAGERQRVALGAALARRPRVLLLDEPFARLDAPLRVQLRGEIRRLQREFGLTVIHVTHDQVEAMALADRLAIVNAGRIEQAGAPLELYRRPETLFAARFLGTDPINVLAGKLQFVGGPAYFVADAAVDRPLTLREVSPVQHPGDSGRKVTLAFRPESLRLTPQKSGDGAEWAAIVEAIEPLGSETLVHLRFGSERLLARDGPSASWRLGETVAMTIHSADRHWFDPDSGQRIESVMP